MGRKKRRRPQNGQLMHQQANAVHLENISRIISPCSCYTKCRKSIWSPYFKGCVGTCLKIRFITNRVIRHKRCCDMTNLSREPFLTIAQARAMVACSATRTHNIPGERARESIHCFLEFKHWTRCCDTKKSCDLVNSYSVVLDAMMSNSSHLRVSSSAPTFPIQCIELRTTIMANGEQMC
jgi:hypothetical protein